MCVAGNKARGAKPSKPFDNSHGATGFVLPGSSFVLVQYFLNIPRFIFFGMVIYTMCHYMLEVCIYLPLEFTGTY